MSELIFKDPPPMANGRPVGSPLRSWLDELRKHPGQWAEYPEAVSQSTASDIRHGRKVGAVAGEFDITTRAIDNEKPHRRTMYARYIGEEAS